MEQLVAEVVALRVIAMRTLAIVIASQNDRKELWERVRQDCLADISNFKVAIPGRDPAALTEKARAAADSMFSRVKFSD